jgi:hypothetical protein
LVLYRREPKDKKRKDTKEKEKKEVKEKVEEKVEDQDLKKEEIKEKATEKAEKKVDEKIDQAPVNQDAVIAGNQTALSDEEKEQIANEAVLNATLEETNATNTSQLVVSNNVEDREYKGDFLKD